MASPLQPEKREYVRVPTEVPVQYKFISSDHFQVSAGPMEGVSVDISMGGLQIVGVLPNEDYIMPLLMQKIALVICLQLPGEKDPLYAIGRVAWVDAIEGTEPKKYAVGLRFQEITRDDLDRIFYYMVHSQLF